MAYENLRDKLKLEIAEISNGKLTQTNLDNAFKAVTTLDKLEKMIGKEPYPEITREYSNIYRLYDDLQEFSMVKKRVKSYEAQGENKKAKMLEGESLGNLMSALSAFKNVIYGTEQYMTQDEKMQLKNFAESINYIITH